jgi:hypothetical protein
MKRIRLKKRPSFYEDLRFSRWLTADRLLAVVLDRRNRVEEVRMDTRWYSTFLKELRALRYI